MNFNQFTIKSQEALQTAFEMAQGRQQQAVEPGHVLKGLFHASENVTGYLLKKLGVNLNMFGQALDRIVEAYPRVSGGEQYLSGDTDKVLHKSVELSRKMGD
ncbi:MAG: Clp protease N-terminal domain-containing protein, partial [Mangrovibacterium sp.]